MLSLTVEFIRLEKNKLQNLINFPKNSTFHKVILEGNKIQYLTEEDFKSVKSINYLELKGNEIRRIDTNTFEPFKNDLDYLGLAVNNIRKLNGCVRFLTRLTVLSLSSNLIETFEDDEFKGLNELNALYLENNKITSLSQLQPIPFLVYAFVENNSIKRFSPDDAPKSLKYLNIIGNPFKCDCTMHSFILSLQTSGLQTYTGICLKEDIESSVEKNSSCPEMCSCGCVNKGDISFIFADCSSKNLSITPQFFNNSVSKIEDDGINTFDYRYTIVMEQYNFLGQNNSQRLIRRYPSAYLKDYVLGINLENNSLEVIDASQLPHNLIQLYLANNKLTRLPDFIFSNLLLLENISLSGNPWICDCDALKFKKWISYNHLNIKDINDTRCGTNKGISHVSGKVIWTLSDYDICPSNLRWIIPAIIGSLILILLCLASRILYVNFKLNIKVFLWSHGLTFVKEEDIDCDKPFDAFLSFSNEDGEFVTKEIIWEIEKKDPDIRLCIHYRDFRPGEYIQDNIVRAIHNSKKTIFILSKNFFESEWCLYEFRTAHEQALEDKIHRIVIIKVGELPEDIDETIKVYLRSTTYLTWGEKYFWKKLIFILPSSRSVRNSVPRNTEETEII